LQGDNVSLSQENNRMTAINRIKVVLVEKQRTNKWLAEQLGKSENTISKWCSNKVQPSLDSLLQIANVLDVEIRSLIVASKSKESYD
jgi:hypothetical protein